MLAPTPSLCEPPVCVYINQSEKMVSIYIGMSKRVREGTLVFHILIYCSDDESKIESSRDHDMQPTPKGWSLKMSSGE